MVQPAIALQSLGGQGEPSAVSIIIDELSDAMPLCAGTINIATNNSTSPMIRTKYINIKVSTSPPQFQDTSC